MVSGESLGSFGAEAAFSGAQDLTTRTDGALFVGPTDNNSLWRRFTADRDPGTPEVLPTYDGGATVRFADSPPDFGTEGTWTGSRIVLPPARERPGHLVGLVTRAAQTRLAVRAAWP